MKYKLAKLAYQKGNFKLALKLIAEKHECDCGCAESGKCTCKEGECKCGCAHG